MSTGIVHDAVHTEYPFFYLLQVLIPVHGSHTAGHLRSTSTHQYGKWYLQRVQLEFKGRPEVVVIIDQDKTL